jgi:hypothetical protein
MYHSANYFVTTKIAKDTKGSDIHVFKLRALHVLRGEMAFPTLVAAQPR